MAKSDAPKKPYKGGDSRNWAQRLAGQSNVPANPTPAVKPPVSAPTKVGMPSKIPLVKPSPIKTQSQANVERGMRAGVKARKIAGGVLLGGAVLGGGYALHRHLTKGKPVTKSLINPFEEVIVFGKAYTVVEPIPRSTRIRALVPTGGHVGHGNALGHYRGGGPAITRTQLQTYNGNGKGLRQGPFGKALQSPERTSRRRAIPNSNIPAGPSRGSRIT